MKFTDWRPYIYWGTAFALVPSTEMLLHLGFGYPSQLYSSRLHICGCNPILQLFFGHEQVFYNILRNPLVINPIFFSWCFIVGVSFCMMYKIVRHELAQTGVFHQIPPFLFAPLFGLYIIDLSLHGTRSQISHVTWLILSWFHSPYFALFNVIDIYFMPAWFLISVLVAYITFFGYVIGFVVLHLYKHIKNRRRVSAPPAGD